MQLTSVTVEGGHIPSISEESWATLAQAVSSHFGEQINTLTLLPYLAHMRDWSHKEPIDIQDIVRPWFTLDNVSHFTLAAQDVNYQLQAREHSIRDIATAWPLLEQLHVKLYFNEVLPISVLYTLAHGCRQLKSLSLPVGGLFASAPRYFDRMHGLEHFNHQGNITSRSVYDDIRTHVFPALPEVDTTPKKP